MQYSVKVGNANSVEVSSLTSCVEDLSRSVVCIQIGLR